MRPLEGIRVLDLSRVLAGPWATQLLADLGAEVIKVEKPGAGDDTRHWGPPWWGEGDERVAAYFLAANRGKRSVAIDFGTEAGAALVRRMAADADVLVENFKVGGLARFGLDAASLRAANPRLVYASITGFGQDGPYAARAGYDYIIQAMGGLMSLTGLPDGEPGGGPMRAGVAVADLFTGMYAANAIQAALIRRARTGEGATIDLALFDVQLAMLANQASNALVAGQDPGRQGAGHPNIVPYQPFAAADQSIIIAVGNDRQFRKFAAILGRPEWADDPKFATNAARVAARGELVPMIETVVATQPAAHWLDRLEAAGVPAGPINGVTQALADPQAVHRGMKREVGGVPLVGSPLRIDGARQDAPTPPPALGADGDLLGEWCDPDELARLRAAGVVG
ncbi:CoA transferase [Sphingomonas sp. ASV193]|uniref:CaiB/BaiF CoA transferase family protein n=1 Tax=Sphingomonas sp. ASV193 TaxID=3144405 RepID=UPI0032E898EA